MECQGLSLALNVVAAEMRLKKTEDEWERALNLMRKVDPSFRIRNDNIDAELDKRLKWSYDELADPNLNICFLYCAVFPEDAEMDMETLVQMWSAEKLVTHMDAGHEYIDALVGQHLQIFLSEDEIRNCKRLSVSHNDIRVLPRSLPWPQLVSLILANNKEITEVKEGFLSAAMSLKVLDLSHTNITTLPTSLGELEQLEFLNLSGCSDLQTLPESIGNLSRLKFLNLECCISLYSLPDNICNLRNLKHLNLDRCDRLMAIPHGISHLTSLNKLFLPGKYSFAINVEEIANLSNLMELVAAVKSEIK